ncbi:MAG: hypothetical protein LBQ58_01885 [Synergistaceae bacterium]|nr:hypothetical protein [Synergistaceae bacterium]
MELIQNKARRLSDMVQDLRNLIEKRQISIPPTVGESNTTAKDTAFSLSHQLNEIENACCKVISQTNNLHADYDCCMCQMNDVAGKLTALSASVKNDR